MDPVTVYPDMLVILMLDAKVFANCIFNSIVKKLDLDECKNVDACLGVDQWCVNRPGSFTCCSTTSTAPECELQTALIPSKNLFKKPRIDFNVDSEESTYEHANAQAKAKAKVHGRERLGSKVGARNGKNHGHIRLSSVELHGSEKSDSTLVKESGA